MDLNGDMLDVLHPSRATIYVCQTQTPEKAKNKSCFFFHGFYEDLDLNVLI
mgnify:CR=1 FL=1